MTDMNIPFSAEELEQILFGNAGVEVLMQKMFRLSPYSCAKARAHLKMRKGPALR